MLLLVSEGGREAGSFQTLLKDHHISYLGCYPTLLDAGTYGCGDAIVGTITKGMLCKTLHENQIWGVVDILSEPYVNDSLLVIEGCTKQKVPYLKYIHFPSLKTEHAISCPTYKMAAKQINGQTGNVLCYAAPQTVNGLAKRVFDLSCIYVPITKEYTFDVERAVQYGIPIRNIIERPLLDGYEATAALLATYDISCVVLDGSIPWEDKLPAILEKKIPVLLVHRYGIDFPHVATSTSEVIAFARKTDKQQSENMLEDDENGNY